MQHLNRSNHHQQPSKVNNMNTLNTQNNLVQENNIQNDKLGMSNLLNAAKELVSNNSDAKILKMTIMDLCQILTYYFDGVYRSEDIVIIATANNLVISTSLTKEVVPVFGNVFNLLFQLISNDNLDVTEVGDTLDMLYDAYLKLSATSESHQLADTMSANNSMLRG